MTIDRPFRLGPWEVDPRDLSVSDGAGRHRLEPKMMGVLCRLAAASEGGEMGADVVTREELLHSVWPETAVGESVLTRVVSLLRTVLEDDSRAPRLIETVPRRGYRLLEAPVFMDGPRREAARLAVLPFVDYSVDPVDHFAAGLTEMLIMRMAQHVHLHVISRTSVMRYAGSERPLIEIARDLGVDFVIEASIQREADEVAVTTQLIDAAQDRHLWADRAVESVGALPGLFERIAADASAVLRPAAKGEAELGSARRVAAPGKAEVVDLYLRGRQIWSTRTPDGFRRAIDTFKQVIRLEPDHVPSWCGVADGFTMLALYGAAESSAVFPDALEAANRALEIDDGAPAALRARAAISLFWEWRWAEAERGFRRALEIDPSEPLSYLGLADVLAWSGRTAEAVEVMRLGRLCDPFDPGMNMNVGDMLLFDGRLDAALAQYEDALAIGPHLPRLYSRMATSCRAMGQLDQAEAVLERAAGALGDPPGLSVDRALLAAEHGDAETAAAWVGRAEESGHARALQVLLAEVDARLGRLDEAFEGLSRAATERAPLVLYLGVEPGFETLRGDARWSALRERVGFRERSVSAP